MSKKNVQFQSIKFFSLDNIITDTIFHMTLNFNNNTYTRFFNNECIRSAFYIHRW